MYLNIYSNQKSLLMLGLKREKMLYSLFGMESYKCHKEEFELISVILRRGLIRKRIFTKNEDKIIWAQKMKN